MRHVIARYGDRAGVKPKVAADMGALACIVYFRSARRRLFSE